MVVVDGFVVVGPAVAVDMNAPEPICDCVPGLVLGEFHAACVAWFSFRE